MTDSCFLMLSSLFSSGSWSLYRSTYCIVYNSTTLPIRCIKDNSYNLSSCLVSVTSNRQDETFLVRGLLKCGNGSHKTSFLSYANDTAEFKELVACTVIIFSFEFFARCNI